MLQPGSTVATALTAGEAARKHAWLLELMADEQGGVQYRTLKLPLHSVRPFVYEAVRRPRCNVITSYYYRIKTLMVPLQGSLVQAIHGSALHILSHSLWLGSSGLKEGSALGLQDVKPTMRLGPRLCPLCMAFASPACSFCFVGIVTSKTAVVLI